MIRRVDLQPTTYASRPAAAAQARADEEPQDRVDLTALRQQTALEASSLETKLPPHFEGEVLVKLRPGQDGLNEFAKEYGCKLIHQFQIPENIAVEFGGELLHLQLPDQMTTAEGIAILEKDERVAYACSNDVLEANGSAQPVVPNDLDTRLWGLNNTGQNGGTAGADIDAPEAWAVTTGSRTGPVICVIDTGIDYNHPDLRNNVWTNPGEIPGDGIDNDGNGVVDDVHGFNAINDSGNPLDDHNHGTHVSGTIAAEGNNGAGVVGVNWQGRIMGAKFLSASGSGSTAGAIKSVLYATANGARITSNSWGGGGYNQALYDALKASPALHIFAAGNESNNNDAKPAYPASYDLPNIVSVAALDRRDRMASFSNWGATSVDLGAPGVDIYSSVIGGRYASYSGTSMACPHVAGVAGLIATAYPTASNEEIKRRLLDGAVPTPAMQGKSLSGGRLNAARALENDETPPAAPGNFQGRAAGSRQVELSWTAPGDDGLDGKASGYELRYSRDPITDLETFMEATPVETPAPGDAGSVQQATLTVTPEAQEHALYFGLRARDDANNFSELATSEVRVPAARIAFDGDGAEGWTADNGWAQVDEPGRGQVWTDSPNGNYPNRAKTDLVSREFSLKGLKNAALVFDAKYSLEGGEDFLHVDVDNGGWWWKEATKYTGESDWKTRVVDLSQFDGQDVKVRFRLKSDWSVNRDGFYLDNLRVVGDPQ
ncbi:MAG: S8 family serine peptidase [Armatimonadetes bacterium]|nr:S8 family serine peptidase [Armatimonadota bacterium]